jgi:hypothetical protein
MRVRSAWSISIELAPRSINRFCLSSVPNRGPTLLSTAIPKLTLPPDEIDPTLPPPWIENKLTGESLMIGISKEPAESSLLTENPNISRVPFPAIAHSKRCTVEVCIVSGVEMDSLDMASATRLSRFGRSFVRMKLIVALLLSPARILRDALLRVD